MPTNTQVEDILRDCIAADPSLRERQDELRPIIAALLKSKPDTRFSKDFAHRLRSMLSDERQKRTEKIRTNPSFFDFMKRLPLALPIAGSLALVAVFAVLLTQKPAGPKTETLATAIHSVTSGPKISKVADGAFGALTSSTAVGVQPPMADGAEGSRNSVAAGTATAMTEPAVAPSPAQTARPQSGGGGSDAVSKMSMMMPYQEPVNYRYVFKGELPDIDPKIDVYRHMKGLPASGMLSSLANVTAGLIDGSRFASGSLQSLSIVEDRAYGYMINLDAIEGAVSLNQNWQRWPHPESSCRDEACYRQYQIKPEQVPGDDEAMAIAEDFISEFGIDRAALGKPSVNSDWRIRPMSAAADTLIYAPDTVSVTFPFLIDGKPSHDESGNPNGVVINVNVREKKVDGMWGLMTNRYEQSSYVAETDATRILKFVTNGGLYASYNDPSFKTVELELGQPEIVLTSYWKDNGDGTGQNLFVPSLRFAVQNPPTDQMWFRKAVTVPLSKDLLDQADAQAAQNGGGGVPTPLMYIRDDVKK